MAHEEATIASLEEENFLLAARVVELEQEVTRLKEQALLSEYPILRLTAADIAEACRKYESYTKDGFYIKEACSRGRYPQIPFETERSRRRKEAGDITNAQERFTATHVRLVCIDGLRPTATGLHASHLCHQLRCLNHLEWEPAAVNYSRHACVTAGKCTGHGCYKKCVFEHHSTPCVTAKRQYKRSHRSD